MAVFSVRCFALAALLIAGILISSNHVSAQTCQPVDFTGLRKNCLKYVIIFGPKISPSADCCNVVNKVDIPCFCAQVPSGAQTVVSLKKVVYVAETCGLKVPPPGTKCGSKNPSLYYASCDL
ncbi:hypothetical protein NE237_002761 [Protea cynaroides]|uniref:Bifunctional inhibitor/plant lipid transfer protein/seed storage helical domain-containing protein n=1 Tax=Protea cynaroides TaxID=273540 RepID=A0A9Q0KFN9_9MAGN|nr:hypothetical protein NE237_002761 [Protea cynaroides]